MRFSFYSLTIFLLSVLLSSITLQAQKPILNLSYDDENKTTAKLLPLIDSVPSCGYIPFRLILKNGTKSDLTWRLKFKSDSNDLYSHHSGAQDTPSVSSSFKYSCPPSSSKTYDILVPVVTTINNSHSDIASSSLSIHLSGNNQEQFENMNCSQHMDLPNTLLSQELYVLHSSKFNGMIPSSRTGYHGTVSDYTTQFYPEKMSDDWRAYSGFDAMILTDNDWKKMSSGAQNAVLEWNRLGGNILLYKLNAASNFSSLGIDNSSNAATAKHLNRSFGTITIRPLADVKSVNVKQSANIIAGKTGQPKISGINTSYDRSKVSSSGWSLQKSLGKLSFNPFFLILILIAFGILVGPVNLFVFAKAGQRHKLFITTPIIAIGASLILILLIIVQDGFGGHGKRVQLIEVRAGNGENKAYIWQEQVARTGVILGGSFETSSPTLITPVPVISSRFSRVTRANSGGASNYVAEHGEKGLSASGDWFQSRSLHGHYLESIIPTRSKITLKNSSGAPVINSSFDYPIGTLIYIDDAAQPWVTSDIASGDTKTLTPSTPADTVKTLLSHHVNMTEKLQRKVEKLSKRKNHFIAFTDAAPAISTLDSINWTKTETILTGVVVK